ncbi:hypothetical protein WA026_000342 [Henosepilachna vigintioctopunctata]|uniref:RNA helicase n=1 Tax=Henosepilachna vigintioctopunctata TaxID=420089 RepID=A0AAW1V5R8_9CUCU
MNIEKGSSLNEDNILQSKTGHSRLSYFTQKVTARELQKAILTKFPIFQLELYHKGFNEIKDVLDSTSFSNLPIQEMKNSQFKQNYLLNRYGEYDEMMENLLEGIERNPHIDEELRYIHKQKFENEEYLKMFEDRVKLPIYKKREKILNEVECNQVVLLSGDTGCGKTTQVPQYILDEYLSTSKGSLCKIICTQPRRISAISVAERVSKERAEFPGISCGYQVRVEKNIPRKHGSIIFVTNGVVLRFMESNPTLNGYSHLILDEIHERDCHSDFLLAMVKRLITKRKDIKIILMSATLNQKSFMEYFNYCPHIQIDRLVYPVEEFFLEDVIERLNYRFKSSNRRIEIPEQIKETFNNWVVPYIDEIRSQYSNFVINQLLNPESELMNYELIFQLTLDICSMESHGAVLIFVTGYDDIKKLMFMFDRLPKDRYLTITLHSQIPMDQQKEVFEETPPGVRKIIISTNIAETSVTIEDVVYVIDCGWSKVKTYDARTKTENLDTKFISKANAIQRKGRAGRTRPGKCFRLYTKGRYNALYKFPRPEIMRIRLEGVILQAKVLGFKSIREFFNILIDQPKPLIIDRSIALLYQIKAIEEGEELTPLGYYLAKLPVAPQLGKIILYGVIFCCLDPILNIVVGMDLKSPFNLNLRMGNEGDPKLLAFSEGCKSDHLLLHKALFLFLKTDHADRESFCKKHNLNMETMNMLKALKHKFMEHLLDLGLVSNSDPKCKKYNLFSENFELVRSVICAGLYPNIVIAERSSFVCCWCVVQILIHQFY